MRLFHLLIEGSVEPGMEIPPLCSCGKGRWYFVDPVEGMGGRHLGFTECFCSRVHHTYHEYAGCYPCGNVIHRKTMEIVGKVQWDPIQEDVSMKAHRVDVTVSSAKRYVGEMCYSYDPIQQWVYNGCSFVLYRFVESRYLCNASIHIDGYGYALYQLETGLGGRVVNPEPETRVPEDGATTLIDYNITRILLRCWGVLPSDGDIKTTIERWRGDA